MIPTRDFRLPDEPEQRESKKLWRRAKVYLASSWLVFEVSSVDSYDFGKSKKLTLENNLDASKF